MKNRLAFTTLGCPDWPWSRVIEKAVEYGYEGLELRGVEREMDLTEARPFKRDRLQETVRELQDRELSVVCLGTSCKLHEPNVEENLEEGRRHIDLAAKLGTPFIRVFGDRILPGVSREEAVGQVAEGLLELGRYAEEKSVEVLIESHGDFSRSEALLEVIRAVDHPNVGILWDVHHPYRFFGEPIEETYARLEGHIRHVHLKDSVPAEDGCLYKLTGEGDVPLQKAIRLLESGGYNGWISFEWEKHWHPEIEEPEIALPEFVRALRRLQTESSKG